MAERKPKKPRKAAPKRSRPRGFGALARKLFVWAVIIGVAAPVALVLVFRFVYFLVPLALGGTLLLITEIVLRRKR